MPSLLEDQIESILRDPRSSQYNIPDGTRLYSEILQDPKTTYPALLHTVEEWVRDPALKRPSRPAPETEVPFSARRPGPVYTEEARAAPSSQEELAGAIVHPDDVLKTGEYRGEDGVSYSPELEEFQRQTISINLGALARGNFSSLDPTGTEPSMISASARYNFELGDPTPGGTEILIELPEGTRRDEIKEKDWDKILRLAETYYTEEFAAERNLESITSVSAKAAGRAVATTGGTLADLMGAEVFRFTDYLLSPIGTNTLAHDVQEALGIREKPRPESFTKDEYERLLESWGLYPTEHPVDFELRDYLIPGAYQHPTTVRRPAEEMFRLTGMLGRQLNSWAANAGMPDLLTFEQKSEAQRIAALVGEVTGGAVGQAYGFKIGAKLFSKGFKFEELLKPNVLQKALMDLANTPSVAFAYGGRRRFHISGGLIYPLKEFGYGALSGTAMALTPEEWGPWGQIATGVAAPVTVTALKNAVMKGLRKAPIVGGFLEPFSEAGQRRLAGRALSYSPGVRGNERLVVALLSDLSEAPKRRGTDVLLETPAYFDEIAERLGQAEIDWGRLSGQGLSPQQILQRLSQNESYGRYLGPKFNLLGGDNTLEKLSQVRGSIKRISDGLYGAFKHLASGSTPVTLEVIRSAQERMQRSQHIFDEMAVENIPPWADVDAPVDFINQKVQELTALVNDSIGAFAADAVLYSEISRRIGENAAVGSKIQGLRLGTTERALLAVDSASKGARTIERGMYDALGANNMEVSPEHMQQIGDAAAELILNTPVAQRKQIPPIIYEIAGRGRLLSEKALLQGDIGAAVGAAPTTSGQLITARATRAQLETNLTNAKTKLDDLVGPAEATGGMDSGIFMEATNMDASQLNVLLGRTPKELSDTWGITPQRAKDLKNRLKDYQKKQSTVSTAQNKLEAHNSKITALEDELLPKFETEGGETVEIGPNGIIDNKTTIDEVLAARGVILGAAAKAVGGKNKYGNKIATELQSYIVDEWIQNPAVFEDLVDTANFSRNYDIARTFSRELNDRFTRGIIGEFWQKGADRQAKVDPNQFLVRLVNESKQSETTLPTGSVDEFEASLVQANSPYIVRENGQLTIDFDRPLTPGMPEKGFTWEQITSGDVPLSTELLREEILNRFALTVVDPHTKIIDPKAVDLFLGPTGYQGVIEKINETIPGFRDQLIEVGSSGEKIAARYAVLTQPGNFDLDSAAASMNLDDLTNVIEAGPIRAALVHDDSVMNLFLGRSGKLYAKKLMADPDKFTTDISDILTILRTDESGSAVDGFRQAVLNELVDVSRMKDPTKAARRGEDILVDPEILNQQLITHEEALRKVFDDAIEGTNYTTYDLLKLFNDETLRTYNILKSRTGAGADVSLAAGLFRGQETIRNLGRILGVKVAGWTGGPALVLAGTGGRLAGKLYESSGSVGVYEALYAALKDPAFAKMLLVDTAKLSKKGKFNFDKELVRRFKPFFAFRHPGTMTEIAERAVEVQREEERKRGEPATERVLDPDTLIYKQQRISPPSAFGPRTPRGEAPPVPARTRADRLPVPKADPASVLSQVNPLTAARGQQVFGPMDPIFSGPMTAAKGGIASIKPKKPRQMVI